MKTHESKEGTTRRNTEMHPSNKLYNGDAHNFEEAMRFLIAACDYENKSLLKHDMEPLDSLDEIRNTAYALLGEYVLRVKKAETELFKKWAASEDETVRSIGEAAMSGDYWKLAF